MRTIFKIYLLQGTCCCLLVLLNLVLVQSSIAQIREPIDSLSLSSFLLRPFSNSGRSWNASGFIVNYEGRHFLVTNWHVVTGRDPSTNSLISGIKPDSLTFRLPKITDAAIVYVNQRISLYSDNLKPRWLEHPLGQQVDVVVLPLANLDTSLSFVPIDLDGGPVDLGLRVAQPLSIIGFPKGLTGGALLPIWKTGLIASEPGVDYSNLPRFVIDARTISGMSGSPVVYRSYDGYSTKSGNRIICSSVTKFIGVYSGRFNVHLIDKTTKSDLGLVWKPEALRAILNNIPDSILIKD